MSDNKKGNTVLLTVIAIATLLVAIVGATFAYFTASVTGNAEASSVIVRTAEIGSIVYENGTELKLENAYPGAYSNTITFTITSSADSTVDVAYAINWVNVTNDFVAKDDLVYTLTGEAKKLDGTAGTGTVVPSQLNKVAPSTSGVIGSGVLAAGGEVHTYTMQMHFKETGSDQNINQGRNFVGKIEVTTSDSGELYYTDQAKSGTTEIPSAY